MHRLSVTPSYMRTLEAVTHGKKIEDLPFSRLCDRLTKCSTDASLRPGTRFDALVPRDLAYLWYTGQSLFPLFRLIMPLQDVNRRTYNVKENRIAKLFAGVLKVPTSSFGMTQYKARSQVGEAAGDFGAAAERSLQGRTRVQDPRPAGSPGPTISQVNAMLDRLAAAEGDLAQRAVVLELLQQLTPREHKWLLRIVLKDLKARIRHESFLSEFHESAREIYNSRNDLSTICSADDFRKPASEHLSTGILFGTAFHPMLCGRFDASGHVGIRVCEKMVTPAGRPAPFAIEDKLDGERLLVHKDGAAITCFTRRTTDYTATYEPVLREAIVTGVKAHRAILDGEMLAFDSTTGEFLKFGENRTVAEEEARGASGSKTMCFVVFDILWVQGPQVGVTREGDITRLALSERRKLLEAIIPPASRRRGKLVVLDSEVVGADRSDPERIEAVERRLDAAVESGSEGLVVKNLASPYVCNARERQLWIKIKPEYMDGSYDTMDVVIVAAYLGEGRQDRIRAGGISKFAVAVADRRPDEGPAGPTASVAARWKTIGKVGTGYSFDQLLRLRELLVPHLKPISTLADIAAKAPYMPEWRPQRKDLPDFVVDHPRNSIVLEVCAAELQRAHVSTRPSFSAGVALRFPRVEQIRLDKPVQETATMSDVVRIMANSDGRLARRGGDSMMLSRTVARARKRARAGEDGTAKRLARSRMARLDGRFVASAAVREQAKEVDCLEGLEAVVYHGSFTAADLDAGDDEAALPSGESPTQWVQLLLRKLGATVSQNCLPSTSLAVAVRGRRVDAHKLWCERNKLDIDVVTPRYIQACLRAKARLDPLPREHLVFAGAATAARLPEYADALGDHYLQPLTAERWTE
ncbi:hypothetical protein FNF28_02243 [Cafeteria roenbergensis]|uniref:DNA ligase (ATP) n=1 Tax=Cafeteria roenbergensis TaxID=33653 RepID=A0A5A8DVP4_CAFRO|nr:hypothetical protein FNF28_02243 [Cafeteria roenbergensis]